MLTDWELWACANHYIAMHGDDAAVIAAMRCDELFAEGDLDGVRNYRAIVARINRLLDPIPDGLLN